MVSFVSVFARGLFGCTSYGPSKVKRTDRISARQPGYAAGAKGRASTEAHRWAPTRQSSSVESIEYYQWLMVTAVREVPHFSVAGQRDFTASVADDLIQLEGCLPSTPGCRIAKGKGEAMTEMMIEEEILSYEVSDEALEATAGTEQAGYTLGSCTGLTVCPE